MKDIKNVIERLNDEAETVTGKRIRKKEIAEALGIKESNFSKKLKDGRFFDYELEIIAKLFKAPITIFYDEDVSKINKKAALQLLLQNSSNVELMSYIHIMSEIALKKKVKQK